MVHGSPEESVMVNPIDEALEECIEEAIFIYQTEGDIDTIPFLDKLEAYGFMIVPIEDPTNLRFGVE